MPFVAITCDFCSSPVDPSYASRMCNASACWEKKIANEALLNLKASEDVRVKAIREDSRIGEGSCSVLDECYPSRELVESLDREGIETPEAAVQWGLQRNADYWGRGLDQLSGEPETDRFIIANAQNAAIAARKSEG